MRCDWFSWRCSIASNLYVILYCFLCTLLYFLEGPWFVIILCGTKYSSPLRNKKKRSTGWKQWQKSSCYRKIVPEKQIEILRRQNYLHIETSLLTYSENQLIGFYMMATFGVWWVNKPSSKLNAALKLEKACFLFTKLVLTVMQHILSYDKFSILRIF